jgi:hypothetical protein
MLLSSSESKEPTELLNDPLSSEMLCLIVWKNIYQIFKVIFSIQSRSRRCHIPGNGILH